MTSTKEKNFAEPSSTINIEEGLIRLDRMYESLRYNDYSTENGLGEIVDNSVEASASTIDIIVKQDKQQDEKNKRAKSSVSEIVVIDDGCGMDHETLKKCLVLGESMHPIKDGHRGIGRFGVGMTLGSISLARRVEVYSRTSDNGDFFYTYIDLDDIQVGDLIRIPSPISVSPPEEYKQFLNKSSGTIVLLKKCDRLSGNFGAKSFDSSDLENGLANYLGRTYRKFISAGLNIQLNNKKVYLHDPLYMAGPTKFDVIEKGVTDPKAEPYGETKIELDVMDTEGEKATVTIRMSLLPKEWRLEKGAGGGNEAKKRKIDQNEGVSILRANREVLYARVPYITGKKGEAAAQEIDRWWGCEISFPPELDDYFQVRYIKRGAEPIASLLDKIRDAIKGPVASARKTIQADWTKDAAEKNQAAGTYGKAEDTMAQVDRILPRNKKGTDVTAEEAEQKIEDILDALPEPAQNKEERERKKAELKKKPYIIEAVKYPQNILFETDYLLDQTIIRLNVNHPFYKQVLLPLCGPMDDGSALEETNQKRKFKDAIIIMLFSFAKAEGMFPNNNSLFENLRSQWGTVLATAIEEYEEK